MKDTLLSYLTTLIPYNTTFGFIKDLECKVSEIGNTALIKCINEGEFKINTLYVFKKITGEWYFDTEFTKPGWGHKGNFGCSFDMVESGGVVVIGEDNNSHDVKNSGVVYLYQRYYDKWVCAHILKPANPIEDLFFGKTVELTNSSRTLNVGTAKGIIKFTYSNGQWTEENS